MTDSIIAQVVKSVENNRFEGIYTLAEKVNYINQVNCYGESALICVSAEGLVHNVLQLLENGANVNCTDLEMNTPLLWSIAKDQTETANILINNGAELRMANVFGKTPLIIAAFRGNLEVIQKMLPKLDKLRINQRDKHGYSALHAAVLNGHTEVVKALLKAKADVNIKNSFGRTPLMLASLKNSSELVNLLISAKSDPLILDNLGENAFMLASKQNNREIMNLLLNHNTSGLSLQQKSAEISQPELTASAH